jgi:hypothetical protein
MRKPGNSNNSWPLNVQMQRLALWLKEWELDRILRKELAKDQAPQKRSSAGLSHDKAGKSPAVGEIRLLHPAGVGGDQGPVYIVILENRPDNTFLIAPFGRFAEPALPGEWLTGLKPVPLRVLCLWNSRVVAEATLNRSWRAGRFSAVRLRQAMELHRHITASTPLVSVSTDDIGPELRHPLDPRQQYQLEESNLLDENLSAAVDQGSLVYEIEDTELRLAAEPQLPYGRKPRRKKK